MVQELRDDEVWNKGEMGWRQSSPPHEAPMADFHRGRVAVKGIDGSGALESLCGSAASCGVGGVLRNVEKGGAVGSVHDL